MSGQGDGLSALAQGLASLAGLLRTLTMLLIAGWVVRRFARTRSLVTLAVSLTLAGLFAWGLHNAGWLLDRARAEAEIPPASSAGAGPGTLPLAGSRVDR